MSNWIFVDLGFHWVLSGKGTITSKTRKHIKENSKKHPNKHQKPGKKHQNTSTKTSKNRETTLHKINKKLNKNIKKQGNKHQNNIKTPGKKTQKTRPHPPVPPHQDGKASAK